MWVSLTEKKLKEIHADVDIVSFEWFLRLEINDDDAKSRAHEQSVDQRLS